MDFCREACDLTIDHFSISVIGHSGCKYWNKAATEQDCLMRVPHIIPSSLQPYPLNEVLSPFRQLLRNAKEVKFDSSLTDAATRDLLDEAKLLLESKDPVVHVFKLYRNLLKDAQNFERCERFKACMATPDGVFRQGATDTPTSREIIYDWHDYGENWAKNADKLRNFTPFKNMAPHPVEHALELAKYASDDNDVEEFKKQRKHVLEYLEPQYQQIVSAAASMLDFVTEHRNLMDYETEEEYVRAEIMAKGNILLKRCGRSFNRKLEGEVKAIAKLHRDFFDSFYKDHQREINLASVTKVANQRNWVRWKYHFDMATLNMNSQYEWIQKTRIRLFQDDLVNADVGCDIVMDLVDLSEVKGLDPPWMLNWPKA